MEFLWGWSSIIAPFTPKELKTIPTNLTLTEKFTPRLDWMPNLLRNFLLLLETFETVWSDDYGHGDPHLVGLIRANCLARSCGGPREKPSLTNINTKREVVCSVHTVQFAWWATLCHISGLPFTFMSPAWWSLWCWHTRLLLNQPTTIDCEKWRNIVVSDWEWHHIKQTQV